jgi:hypothetical protein
MGGMRALHLVLAIALSAATAAAQPIEAVWDGASGLTPDQVCPAWTLTDTAPGADPVLDAGVLTLSTAAVAEDMFYVQTALTTPAPDPIVIEARLRFTSGSSNLNNRGPAAIAVTTAANTGTLFFVGADDIFLTADGDVRGPSASVDTDGAFHTYRIEITAAGVVTVAYDGTPTLTGATYTSAPAFGAVPRILWGEGSIVAFGTHAWESFRHNAATCDSGTTTTGVPTTTTTSTTEASTSTETPTTSEPASSTTVEPTTSSSSTVEPTTSSSSTLVQSTTSSSSTLVVPTTSSSSAPPTTLSTTTSTAPGASTTSSTTTPHSTTTTTLAGGCDDVSPGSLPAVRCRLDILAARIDGEAGLGKLRAKLAATLDRAVALAREAADACTAADTKKASRRMKQVQKLLQQMAHRLRGLAARKQVDAGLRAELLATIDSIRADVGALRRNPCD